MKYCAYPFKYINTTKGFMYPCCASWLSTSFDKLKFKDNGIDPVYTWFNTLSPLRESIIDGSYKYCSSECPVLKTGFMMLNKEEFSNEIQSYIDGKSTFISYPEEIGFSFDATCNLCCKTCRKTHIKDDSRQIQVLGDRYSEFLEYASRIRLSGDGDPFASPYYFNLLKCDLSLICRNLKFITLQTNATLFNEHTYNEIHVNNRKLIDTIVISVDAVTYDTYKNVRGGNFDVLCKNLQFISELKEDHPFFLDSIFTISKNNYFEAFDFIDFAYKYKFDAVRFDIMKDWGRGFSVKEVGISANDKKLVDILNQIKKKSIEYAGKMNIDISFDYDDSFVEEIKRQNGLSFYDKQRININNLIKSHKK